MATTTEPTALIARFDDPAQATRFVRALRRAGFRRREIAAVSPRREILFQQALIGLWFGALAGLVVGVFAGLYLTGSIPGVNPILEFNRILGIFYTALAFTGVGAMVGSVVALFIPAEESGFLANTAKLDPTVVVVQAKDPAQQEKAVEILQTIKIDAPAC
jgi:hypothetical protein